MMWFGSYVVAFDGRVKVVYVHVSVLLAVLNSRNDITVIRSITALFRFCPTEFLRKGT